MKLKELFGDEDAVSPVIGVILMVAITVILAAVIGAFVLGLGNNQNVAPQVQFDTEESDDPRWANFTHTSGDTIDDPSERLSFAGPVNSTDNGAHSSQIEDGSDSSLEVGDKMAANLTADAESGDDV